MPIIFTTDASDPYDTEIANVGVLGGSARGGIPVERAARTLRELQDEDGKPLSGRKLEVAAERFARDRGLVAKSVKSVDEEALRVESGAFPAGKSIREISGEASERELGAAARQAEADAEPDTND